MTSNETSQWKWNEKDELVDSLTEEPCTDVFQLNLALMHIDLLRASLSEIINLENEVECLQTNFLLERINNREAWIHKVFPEHESYRQPEDFDIEPLIENLKDSHFHWLPLEPFEAYALVSWLFWSLRVPSRHLHDHPLGVFVKRITIVLYQSLIESTPQVQEELASHGITLDNLPYMLYDLTIPDSSEVESTH